MLRRRLPILWGFAVAFLLLAIIICIVSTRRYEATGTIQVAKESSDSLGLDNLIEGVGGGDAGDSLSANINIETQASILHSDTLALQTIKMLNLEASDDFQPHLRDKVMGWLIGWMSPTGVKDSANAILENSPQRRRHVLEVFSSNLKVKSMPGTRLIEIRYLSSDPKVAADVINTLTQALIDYNFQTRYNATENASSWLSAQMEGLRQSSEALQAQVAQMQRDSGVYSIGTTDAAGREQAYSGVLDRLQQDTVALTAATQNQVVKGAVYEAAKSGDAEMLSGLAGNGLSSGLSNGINNSLTVIQSLRAQQGTLNAQIQQDLVKFGSSYPKLAEEKANVAGLEKAIREEAVRLAKRAKTDYDIALATEASTRKEYEDQKAAADVLNDKAIKYVITRQEALDSRALYEDLLKHLKEAGVLQGLKSTNITVVDKGRIPAKPKWPNVPIYLIAGLLVGLGIGFVAAILVDRLDNKIQESEEIEHLGFTLIGLVPLYDRSKIMPGKPEILQDPRSSYSESIRKLCSALMLSRSAEPPKTVLVTSAVPNEGKSMLSANIAASFALQGKKVLLVEADLRRPMLANRMGIENRDGLSQLLSTEPEVIVNVAYPDLPHLFLLPAGSLPPYPAELLASERMRFLMKTFRENYDIVILDGPPVLPVVDALILCEIVDSTVQVARLGLTSRISLKRANGLLEARCQRSVGVVLNAVNARSGAYYGYYGYQQSEYYGNGSHKTNEKA